MIRLLLASFDPRNWPAYAQNLRQDDIPVMLPIAAAGTIGFSGGLLSGIPYAHLALVIMFSPLLLVSTIGAALAMYDSMRSAFRSGLRSSQSWFELAHAALIAGALMSIATIAGLYFEFSIIELTGSSIVVAFSLFLFFSLIGYLPVAIRKKRPPTNGTVDFFLPQFLAAAAVIVPCILFGKFIDPIYIVGYIVIVALTLAATLKVLSWKRESSLGAKQQCRPFEASNTCRF